MDKIKTPAFWTAVGTLLGGALLNLLSAENSQTVIAYAGDGAIWLGCGAALLLAIKAVLSKRTSGE